MTYSRYIHIYIYINRKISIEFTCVGLASACPNYVIHIFVDSSEYTSVHNTANKQLRLVAEFSWEK